MPRALKDRYHFDAQIQERDGRYGFVLTITDFETQDEWTSPWVESGDTAEEASEDAKRQFRAFIDALNGTRRLKRGDRVLWTSEQTGDRHSGVVVEEDNGIGKALVRPDHLNLRWSAWVPHDHLEPYDGSRGVVWDIKVPG